MVILNSKLVGTAEKWNLKYLEQNTVNGDFTVFVSQNHKFKYYDDKKIAHKTNNGEISKGVEFQAPTRKVDMKLPEFIKRLQEHKKEDERLYLQQVHTLKLNFRLVYLGFLSCFKVIFCYVLNCCVGFNKRGGASNSPRFPEIQLGLL